MQFGSNTASGAEETALDRFFGNAKRAGDLCDGHVETVIEYECSVDLCGQCAGKREYLLDSHSVERAERYLLPVVRENGIRQRRFTFFSNGARGVVLRDLVAERLLEKSTGIGDVRESVLFDAAQETHIGVL